MEKELLGVKPLGFASLRTEPWDPRFKWVNDLDVCADTINQPHEDYPARVHDTAVAIRELGHPTALRKEGPTEQDILAIHQRIFGDKPFGGQYRSVNVRVALHVPPAYEIVPKLMAELAEMYRGRFDDIDTIKAWYNDFETIHPFQDGNGRVGGVIVGMYSHALMPDKGWLTPGQ